MTVICLDAGTTMVKAVGYHADGSEVAVVRQPATVTRPSPSWAEQDMTAVSVAVFDSIRGVVDQIDEAVDFIAFTAQGDGSWLVDSVGAPTGPAILWNDGRAAEYVDGWLRNGVLDQAFGINGSLTSSGLPNAILSWLHDHDPARLERSVASLTCGGWIFAQLTGEVGIDESDASAPFLDIRSRSYSDPLLHLYDLDWARPLLPELRGDDRRVAGLTSNAADRLGLPTGTPVVMAPYDIASTAIGVGAVEPGQACSILGTTLCTEVVTDQVSLGEEAAGLTVASGVPGRYLRAFPTLAGTEVIQWTCSMLGLDDPLQLGDLAASCGVGAGGLTFLPYFSPAGERAPFLDPQARGSFLGMSFEHNREHVARAVLEGLTLVIRDCLTASCGAPSELRVCGGGAASALWLQMIADVCGVPVSRSTDTEVGARGAFLIGLVATGAANSVEDAAARYVRLGDTYRPDPDRAARYTELFSDFVALRDATAASWPLLAQMRQRSAPPASTDVHAANLEP